MKKLLLTRVALVTVLSLSLSNSLYSQTEMQTQVVKEERLDESFKMKEVSGVGTHQIVYSPGVSISSETAISIKAYLEGITGISNAQVDQTSGTITIDFVGLTSHESVSYILLPMAFKYFNSPKERQKS